jgi:hypothetical protein
MRRKYFFITLLCALATVASASPIIYQQTFDGVYLGLHGTSPDVGGGTWVATSNLYLDGQITAGNGSAVLPFIPLQGHVYILSADFAHTSNTADWFGLGFANDVLDTWGDTGQPTLANASRFTGASIPGYSWIITAPTTGQTGFMGPGATGSVVETGYTDILSSNVSLEIVLDTTSTNWATWYYVNNRLMGTTSYTGSAPIDLVGITTDTPATGSVSNFLFVEAARNPSPANTAIGVSPTSVTFQWNKASDPDNPTVSDPNIVSHVLRYIKYDVLALPAEPNVLDPGATTVSVADTTDPVSYGPVAFDKDYRVYWRVDHVLDKGGTVAGATWFFETELSIPVILGQPVDQAVFAGETATFSVVADTSPTTITYAWFKSTDAVNNTPGDDVSVGTNSSILDVTNAQLANQGYYYCSLTNVKGTVVSDIASLGIKDANPVAYWTLDLADFDSTKKYLDSSSYGRHATPEVITDSNALSFVAGVDPTETNEGLNVGYNLKTAGVTSDTSNPSKYTKEITVSAWVKWAGANGAYQGIVCKRYNGNESGAASDFSWYMYQGSTNMVIYPEYPAWAGDQLTVTGGVLPVGEWTHLAFTVSPTDPNDLVLYINGEIAAVDDSFVLGTKDADPFVVGATDADPVTKAATLAFNGILDDVRVYNYAMSHEDVVDLFYAVTETPVCLDLNAPELVYDFSDDCKVNLDDFAMFAATWLNTGLYPTN